MITFESYERREKQILSKLAEYGIGSIEVTKEEKNRSFPSWLSTVSDLSKKLKRSQRTRASMCIT